VSFEIEVRVEAPINELVDFLDDIENIVDEWKKGILGEIRRESEVYSRRITHQRLPSGGGSYSNAIKWRYLQRGPIDYVAELYNNHQWAQAVEFGTRPHTITSDKVMKAKPILAVPGGKERPWGMRYRAGAVYGRRFEHPGGRAFHIFRDTARRISAVSMRIVENVFRRVRKKYG